MASASGRKKSIISSQNLSIETPVAGNTLLNKSASQATSLYQQCSSLRSRLMRIRGFPHYFQLAQASDARQSTDPVTQLWDVFSLGISLCFIFDQLDPSFAKINRSDFDQAKFDANPEKEKKQAIAHFTMQVSKISQAVPGVEPFTVTDLWDRKSTDGLVKVINTVTAIVEYLPEDIFEPPPPSPPTLSAHESSDSLQHDALPPVPAPPANAREARRNHITREIIETERKYVEGLEIMQKYATQLAQQNIIDQDTIHLLFPNLNNLLNFQRKFLIRLETTREQPWADQKWGQHFLDCEEEFSVYEPYCSNFTIATELLVANEQNLAAMNGFISVSELKAFHITPIQRVCKYPLFFGEMIKVATGDDSYAHLEGLKQGGEAAHRITAKINEAHRRADNEQIVKALAKRITDWKGHHLENFGELLLEDVFVVTKSDIDREYHVFLFEKIILCCKEALQPPPNGRGKNAKNNSLLKKQPAPLPIATGAQSIAQRDTPLLLKGRIFLGNVTQALSVPARASTASGIAAHFPLQVWWKGDDDLEFFTLRCKREDQMKQWESTINRLIKEAAQRRASERPHGSSISRVAQHSPVVRVGPGEPNHSHFSAANSSYSAASSTLSTRSSTRSTNHSYHYESSHTSYSATQGPQGYPPHDGFDRDEDEDDLEDYPPASTSYSSGRGTPMGTRRPNALSMPADRIEPGMGYERPRAQTESNDGPTMAQWRSNNIPGATPTTATGPPSALRPHTPRMNSNMSATSYASDSSFGNGLPSKPNQATRPVLRSQFSSTRLKSGYDAGLQSPSVGPVNNIITSEYRNNGRSPTPNGSRPPEQPMPPPPGPPMGMNRSRSMSQPSAYVPSKPMPAPPVPQWNGTGPGARGPGGQGGKRGSGSSQDTAGSSDYSPNSSSSPVTPYGSSESSLAGVGKPTSRKAAYEAAGYHGVGVHPHHSIQAQQYNGVNGYHGSSPPTAALSISGQAQSPNVGGPMVKVKVHFHEDIFVIQVSKATEYEELVEKVGRKIRLCGPRRDDGPLRVKYKDEDGDMISLGSTEDVQMAFEQWRPGGQVTLFVT